MDSREAAKLVRRSKSRWRDRGYPAWVQLVGAAEERFPSALDALIAIAHDERHPYQAWAGELVADRWVVTRESSLRKVVRQLRALATDGKPRLITAALHGQLLEEWRSGVELVELFEDEDEDVRAGVVEACAAATGDQLYALWALSEHEQVLNALLHNPAKPDPRRVPPLSSIALGADVDPGELLDAALHAERAIGRIARRRILSTPSLTDRLCEAAIGHPRRIEFLMRHGLQPEKPLECALYLLRANQIEAYQEIDPQGTLLARAKLTDEQVKQIGLAFADNDEQRRLWEFARTRPFSQAVELVHLAGQWRPDGDWGLFAQLAEIETLQVVHELTGSPEHWALSYRVGSSVVQSVSLSPDATRIAATAGFHAPTWDPRYGRQKEQGSIIELEVSSGNELSMHTVEAGFAHVLHLGHSVITAENTGAEGSVLARHIGTDREILAKHGGSIEALARSLNGFVAVTNTGELLVGSGVDGEVRRAVPEGDRFRPASLSVHSRTGRFALGGAELALLDADAELLASAKDAGWVRETAFVDADTLLTMDGDGHLSRWARDGDRLVRGDRVKVPPELGSPLVDLRVVPARGLLAAMSTRVGSPVRMVLFDLATLTHAEGFELPGCTLATSADGEHLALGTASGLVWFCGMPPAGLFEVLAKPLGKITDADRAVIEVARESASRPAVRRVLDLFAELVSA
ncbi:hypothetical protein [Allokutzneria sp. NRRL B-24872]|uniref:hypothetical protein n=1 Tax=Allokutzneria sp. NRRL B-24872 TaxID=1137961 RepID=UPI000A3B402D|nr:hypothetical protein [Allokutzneria sp. NRRL B-24872]